MSIEASLSLLDDPTEGTRVVGEGWEASVETHETNGLIWGFSRGGSMLHEAALPILKALVKGGATVIPASLPTRVYEVEGRTFVASAGPAEGEEYEAALKSLNEQGLGAFLPQEGN